MDLATVVLRLRGDPCDVRSVDLLARLALQARRAGCSLEITEVAEELVTLLHLVGLSAEVLGEPEHGEQPGLDEGVGGDDGTA